MKVSSERDRYEREADTAADQAFNSPALVQLARPHLTPVARTGNLNSVQLKEDDEKSNSNWIMDKVGSFIRNIPGYDILTLIIGRDPITGQEVKRDGIAFVKAIVGLIPGGKAIFENLEKAGVISRAVEWFKEEFKKLDLSFNTIKSLFNQAVEAIFGKPKENEGFFSKLGRGLVNLGKALLSPVETFNKLKHIFLGPIQRILTFVGAAGMKLLEFVFEGALTLAGAPVNMIMGILNKGKEVLGKIIKDPIGFLKNLLGAVKNGLGNFVSNIVSHLQNGLTAWLFGALSNAGIVLPDKFSLAGIFSVVSQILGVTWQAIKGLIVKKLGPIAEKVIGIIEKSIGFVVALITKGPMALLDMAQEFLNELKTMFFDSLIEWVRNTIIVKAIQKLISMFNPVGAIIQAIITIYNTIQFFIERAKQIAAFVGAVFNSIAEIANGNLGKAVTAVEGALAKGLPVAISFLANLIGLGGIAKKIQEIIKKVRKPIDKVIGKVVGFIVDKAKKLFRKMIGAGKGEEKETTEKLEKVNRGLAAIDQEEKKYLENGKISKEDAEKVATTVKKAFPVFKSLTVVDGGGTWDYDYVASPGKIKKGQYEKEEKGFLTPKQLNLFKIQVLQGKDIEFSTKEQALEFINKKFGDFPQEIAGSRSAQGWHFDKHAVNGVENVEHINLYSKEQGFRVHITWRT
ncbi:MAG TPA: hypothetical protein VHY08_12460 [Bacillota bacterium]|nr:hypothetical protein [Bacillota bacterium]